MGWTSSFSKENIMAIFISLYCPVVTDRRKPRIKKSGLEIGTDAVGLDIWESSWKIHPWKSHLAAFCGFSAPESKKCTLFVSLTPRLVGLKADEDTINTRLCLHTLKHTWMVNDTKWCLKKDNILSTGITADYSSHLKWIVKQYISPR